MDFLVGMESHSKELEAGWRHVKQMLLECSMANSFMPHQYLSIAFREGKTESYGREGTGKQHWISQNSSALGNLLTAIAVSCCAQHFQGGGRGLAMFPAFSFWQSCPGPCRQGMDSMRPGWQLGAGSRQVGCPGLCRCRAIQRMHLLCLPPTLWPISCAGPIFPHICCLFILSAFPQWKHLTEAQKCIAISTQIGGAAAWWCRAGSRTSHGQR